MFIRKCPKTTWMNFKDVFIFLAKMPLMKCLVVFLCSYSRISQLYLVLFLLKHSKILTFNNHWISNFLFTLTLRLWLISWSCNENKVDFILHQPELVFYCKWYNLAWQNMLSFAVLHKAHFRHENNWLMQLNQTEAVSVQALVSNYRIHMMLFILEKATCRCQKMAIKIISKALQTYNLQ